MERDTKDKLKQEQELFEKAKSTGDPEGYYLKHGLDNILETEFQLDKKIREPESERISYFYYAYDTKEDKDNNHYALKFELAYFPKDVEADAEIWIETIFLSPQHQRKGVATKILRFLCQYSIYVHKMKCRVGIFNIANENWEQHLLSKGTVSDGMGNIILI